MTKIEQKWPFGASEGVGQDKVAGRAWKRSVQRGAKAVQFLQAIVEKREPLWSAMHGWSRMTRSEKYKTLRTFRILRRGLE